MLFLAYKPPSIATPDDSRTLLKSTLGTTTAALHPAATSPQANGSNISSKRQLAKEAIISLLPFNIGYQDMVGEGVDANVLLELYQELGLPLAKSKPLLPTPLLAAQSQLQNGFQNRSETSQTLLATKDNRLALVDTQQDATASEAHTSPMMAQPSESVSAVPQEQGSAPLSAQQFPRPPAKMERKDRIAQLLAQKGRKASPGPAVSETSSLTPDLGRSPALTQAALVPTEHPLQVAAAESQPASKHRENTEEPVDTSKETNFGKPLSLQPTVEESGSPMRPFHEIPTLFSPIPGLFMSTDEATESQAKILQARPSPMVDVDSAIPPTPMETDSQRRMRELKEKITRRKNLQAGLPNLNVELQIAQQALATKRTELDEIITNAEKLESELRTFRQREEEARDEISKLEDRLGKGFEGRNQFSKELASLSSDLENRTKTTLSSPVRPSIPSTRAEEIPVLSHDKNSAKKEPENPALVLQHDVPYDGAQVEQPEGQPEVTNGIATDPLLPTHHADAGGSIHDDVSDSHEVEIVDQAPIVEEGFVEDDQDMDEDTDAGSISMSGSESSYDPPAADDVDMQDEQDDGEIEGYESETRVTSQVTPQEHTTTQETRDEVPAEVTNQPSEITLQEEVIPNEVSNRLSSEDANLATPPVEPDSSPQSMDQPALMAPLGYTTDAVVGVCTLI